MSAEDDDSHALRKWRNLPAGLAVAMGVAAAGCRSPILIADERMPGYEICSAVHEDLALVRDTKKRTCS